ncbi:PepSY-associated TM helix domain-containing protein [Novosphingobium terrae]|uniref:PepSY-associated TM helix domain-containing protein n=1 Tax=Novosphingobium terrae TaxID=2726189 RepID=UPI00197DFA3F|nr:PepSY domain-containing protein [Novosphingobium terrae]
MTSTFYRTVWRWHFYAGLLVLPLVILLSLSGALFLFKPQVERWEERAFHNLPTHNAAPPSAQVAAALAAFPGAHLTYYRLPEREGDAAMLHLALADGTMTDAFVSPQGRLLGTLRPDNRIIAIDRNIHGQLLLGRRGSWIVELAASWAIVLIVTGLYLWWPRGRGLAGTLWPRLTAKGRVFWRDLHAVTGFWVSGLALVLLLTGLPWADAWGSAFLAIRQEMGWMQGTPDWTIGGRPAPQAEAPHAEHDHAAMMAGMDMAGMDMPGMHMATMPMDDDAMLDTMVTNARNAHLAFPALVVPPGMPSGEGSSGKAAQGWAVRSDAQNRPLRVTLHYDAQGQLTSREDITNRHPIDRVVAYGVAWHEGQLFGWINQLIGLATALMLITLAVSGGVMWWRRRPQGQLGAPRPAANPARLQGVAPWALMILLLVWLPLFTLSLAVLLPFDRWLLPRLPALSRWLGATRAISSSEPASGQT